MTSFARSTLATSVLFACASTAIAAPELSGYVTATTDYVRRGVTQSDDHAAIQLGLDLNFDNGFYLGAWGSSADISSYPDNQRDIETNYYIGYVIDAGTDWTLGANAVAYSYPGARGSVDYDYMEYTLSANFDDTFWFEYAYTPDLYHSDEKAHNYQVYIERPVFSDWVMGGGIGYYDVSRLSGSGYGYWQFGLTRPIRRFEFDLRYHDTNRPVPFVSSTQRAESRAVLSVTYSF